MKRKFGLATATFALAMMVTGCQQTVEQHVHTFSEKWSFGTTCHWHDATCGHDEKKDGFEPHNLSDWQTVSEPTEEDDGLKERTCVCGYKETEVIVALGHHHNLKLEWSIDASSHWHAYDCGRNGHFEDKENHVKNAGTMLKTPTCTEKGTKKYQCTVCKYEWSEEIPANGHATVNEICTVCGNYCFHESVQKVDSVIFEGKSFDIVTFGDFPQTLKAESVTVDETKTKTMGYLTYYLGDDSFWYAKRSSSEEDNYYKVEPIKWRVLTDDYSGKSLLLTERLLVGGNIPYYESRETHRNGSYPCNYQHSQIRAYLNGISYDAALESDENKWTNKGFLQTAFTETGMATIAVTHVDNNWGGDLKCDDTLDKIFLLSVQEVMNPDYGFAKSSKENSPSRVKKLTDYGEPAWSYWWLRSPGANDSYYKERNFRAFTVTEFGNCGSSYGLNSDHVNYYNGNPGEKGQGIAMALCVSR